MTTTYTVRIADTAASSIEDQVHHLADHYDDEAQALEKVLSLVDKVVELLADSPLAFPISAQASELGVTHYRELNTQGYRAFYEVVDTDVVLLLVLRQKQDVSKALIRYCLIGQFD